MSLQNYNNGSYLAKNPSWHTEDSFWKAGKVIHMLQKNQLQPASICEIGCGAGEILKALQQQLPPTTQFTGYEVSNDVYDVCVAKKNEHLRFVFDDLLKNDNRDFYDLLLVLDVFEHVEDYINFVRNCKEKASYKIFHIPLDVNLLSLLRQPSLLKTRQLFGHLHYFTKDTALATLNDLNYQIIDFFYTGSSIDVPAANFRKKLAKLPRKLLFGLNKDFAAKSLGGYSLMVLAK